MHGILCFREFNESILMDNYEKSRSLENFDVGVTPNLIRTMQLQQLIGYALTLALVVAGCGCISQGSGETISGTGTVTYVGLEDGFYGIVTEGGEHYVPLNLQEACSQDGLSVRFEAKPKSDAATTQMWGTPIEIVSITPISVPPEPPATIVNTTGTVQFVALEGGFFGIVADDQTRYYPLNLDPGLKVDGQRLWFRAELRENVSTLQIWGTAVEIRGASVISTPPAPEGTISARGTVRYVDVEGGFYGLVIESGERYYPLNLEENFREDGLAVSFRGELQEDTLTLQMWGTPLTITEMERAR